VQDDSVRPIFTDVDRSAVPQQAIDLLNVQHASDFILKMEERAIKALDIHVGHQVLDAGCGTGKLSLDLAAHVGNSGRVIGIDVSATMIAEAKRRSRNSTLPVLFAQGDLHRLQFRDTCFDRCYSERTFQHLPDPRLALGELLRMTRPGGKIVILEPDHDLVIIDTPYVDINRRFIAWRSNTFQSGGIAHQLYRMFKEFGAVDVTVQLLPVVFTDYELRSRVAPYVREIRVAQQHNIVTQAEADMWSAYLEQAIQEGRFLCTQTSIITAATKPL
jgi:ubiquinone/menaquinone biosynthesis C-methylase UbiE